MITIQVAAIALYSTYTICILGGKMIYLIHHHCRIMVLISRVQGCLIERASEVCLVAGSGHNSVQPELRHGTQLTRALARNGDHWPLLCSLSESTNPALHELLGEVLQRACPSNYNNNIYWCRIGSTPFSNKPNQTILTKYNVRI
jgi:hypothetical protein